jgi:predicted transposase/invertase (TIGR01784 family)
MLLAEYDYDTDIAVQRREAFDDGVAIGEKVGEERGRNEAKLETAKTLLAFGDSIEKVSKVTGLSVEEIEKL